MRYPQIRILDYVIMPDHIHLLLFVQEQMPQHLGRVVASLKAKCSQAWWRLQGGDGQQNGGDGMLKRTALEGKPDLFRVRQHLRIGAQEYASMGNIFLLKRADKQQVFILLRENGFAEYEKPHDRYFEACANGTLLLLSPWEYHTDRRSISRSQCLSLNDMDRSIWMMPRSST